MKEVDPFRTLLDHFGTVADPTFSEMSQSELEQIQNSRIPLRDRAAGNVFAVLRKECLS